MVRFLLVRVIPLRTTISADVNQVLKDIGAPLISQQNFDYRPNFEILKDWTVYVTTNSPFSLTTFSIPYNHPISFDGNQGTVLSNGLCLWVIGTVSSGYAAILQMGTTLYYNDA